jgi:hypothetical protein
LCRNLAGGETVPMETILSYKMIVRESTGLRPY